MPGMSLGRLLAIGLLAGVLLGLEPGAACAAERDAIGHWQGTLQGMLRIVVHVERTADGGLRATMDSPDQGATGLALDSLVVTEDSLRFELRRVRGGYAARWNATGDTLSGAWTQSGMSLPLVLARTAHPSGPRRSQVVAPPYPYDTLAVAFDNPRAPGVHLAGTLTLPEGRGPFPAVLLITGSGPEDRDETVFGHHPFRVLADHLTRHGIAVLRVDDRGVGGSTGSPERATSEDFASDALAGFTFLRAQPRIDRRRVGLLGHSEGGLIAPLVASRTREVAFIVMLAGPGVRGDSLLLLQGEAARRAQGVTETFLARERAIGRRVYARLIAGDSVGVAAAMQELVDTQLAALPEASRAAAGDPARVAATAMRQLWSPWMRYFAAHDPAPVLRRVRCPVLALNGERDVQVTPRENLAGIESALRAGGNRDFTVRELPGLNHLFQECHSCSVAEYAQLEETFAPSALEQVSDWIRAHTGLAH
jgi:pimeloyl-ACP methyl ester carboxylesterase